MNWFGRSGKVLSGVALALAIALITHFEGTVHKAYLDPIGVLTICTGHTGSDVHYGDTVSDATCHDMLVKDVQDTWNGISQCIAVPLTDYQKAAFVSFAFNVGVGNFCNSTMLKLFNQGKITEACNELPKWVFAKGQVLPGLVNRRIRERKLCLGEL